MRIAWFALAIMLALVSAKEGDGSIDDAEFENAAAAADKEESPPAQPPVQKAKYVKPSVKGDVHFLETFDLDSLGTKWLKSKAKKDGVDDAIAKYDGEWLVEESFDAVFDGDKGLVLKSKAKHHAVSARLGKTYDFRHMKPLVVQYEVKFQNPLECGGAYVKLLVDEPKLSLESFFDKTDFSIMFGPDKCGAENKYHFIIRYKHPLTGEYEEKHAKKSEVIDTIYSDGKTHLFTLIVKPDNTFRMLIDQAEVNSGSLLSDLTPAINPPKEIVDPNDKKPEGWDEREKIPDPDAVKPEDWDENAPKTIVDASAVKPAGWLDDESATVPDPAAVKPDDWDAETDGEWEAPRVDNPKCQGAPGCGPWQAPQIPNPAYRGKWKAPLIENTNYQGKWEPRKIANPAYFEDSNPFVSLSAFSAIGLELWSMTENIYFDNFIITDDEAVAEQFATDTWAQKKIAENANSKSSESVIDSLINATNDRPWMWAVYMLVVLLPIVIIVVFCCGKSSTAPPPTAAAAAASTEKKSSSRPEETKKTDASTKDDDEDDSEKPAAAAAQDEDDVDLDDAELVDDEGEPPARQLSKSDLEADEDAVTTPKEDEGDELKTKAVKRKPRKI